MPHGIGRKKSDELRQLIGVVGRTDSDGEARGSFGSIDSEDRANILLQGRKPGPADLARDELIELVQALVAAEGTQARQNYWIKVLEENTGDPEESRCIHRPSQYA